MFYVEVKFQEERFSNDKIEWFKPYQLERSKKLDKENHPIFLVFGLGGNPQNPEEIFIIPVSKVGFTSIYDDFLDIYGGFLEKYKFKVNKPVLSSYLWNL